MSVGWNRIICPERLGDHEHTHKSWYKIFEIDFVIKLIKMIFDPQGYQFNPRVSIHCYSVLLIITFNLICHMIMFEK